MMNSDTMPKALPSLDNIETSENCFFTEKASNINTSCPQKTISEYEKDIETYLQNNSDTIKSAEYYKNLADELSELLSSEQSILQDRAEKIYNCGSYLETYDDKIIYANFCRQRICPMCQRRRSLRTAVNVRRMVDKLSELNYKYLHLVLTVPNVSALELSETIDNLYKASSDLFRDKLVKNKFKGVIRCLEVTYNDRYRIDTDCENIGKCFHPHLHCLVAVSRSYGSGKNYLSKVLLNGLWLEKVNKYFCNNYDFCDLHIEAVKGDINSAVAEIAKYCVKPLELSAPDDVKISVYEVLQFSLGGRRLIQLYGCFRDVAKSLKIDIDSLDEELQQLDLNKVKRYNFNHRTKSYELN